MKETRKMETLLPKQHQKHHKGVIAMTDAEEYEPKFDRWKRTLPRSNSFVPSQRRLKAECYPVEPSADVRKMPNTQLARQLSQSIATG